jgi:hypothetical protein
LVGKTEEARTLLKHVLEHDKDNEQAKQALEALGQD